MLLPMFCALLCLRILTKLDAVPYADFGELIWLIAAMGE